MNLKPLWGITVNLKAILVAGVLLCSLIGAGRAEAVEPKVATGLNFTVYLAPDGTVWTWGDNSQGQLGFADLLPRTSPTQVAGLSNVISVAAGYHHALALKADGTVWAWGRNSEGQLSQGSAGSAQATPVQVLVSAGTPLTGIGSIACGGFHSMALAAPTGFLYSWGYNGYGNLGNGNTTQQNYAVNTGYNFRSVSGGLFHSVGIGINGAPYAWGNDDNGQLGNDAAFTNMSTPTLVAGGFTDVVSISAGGYHSIMCRANSSVYCWGDDSLGQLGNGAGVVADQTTPYAIGFSGWKVVAGYYHSLILYPGGYVYAVGDNSDGQCRADPSVVTRYDSPTGLGWLYPRPGEVVGGGSANHVMMTGSNGALMGWGDNSYGQLGLGSTSNNSFNIVNPSALWSLDVFISLSAGNAHTLGLKADGTVWAWGSDGNGQLGDDALLASKTSPVQVSGLSGVMEVCAGGYHSLALTTSGSVYGWGWDSYGQLGNDATIADSPTPVSLPLSYICGLGAGAYHSLAIYSFGRSVRSWGYNGSGQLGDATNTQQPTPVTVSGSANALKVEAGYQHSMALLTTGAINSWGGDYAGQLGNDASFAASNVPVVVSVGNFQDLAAGQSHSTGTNVGNIFFLNRSYGWGDDGSGQVGNGATTGSQPTPVFLTAPFKMKKVAAGADYADFSIYLANDGLVYACGSDNNGQLGNDVSLVNQESLVQVSGLTQICAITAGDYHGHALGADGTLYSWGYNGLGQLGNGVSGANSPTPIVISTDTWKPAVSVTIADSSAGEAGPNTGTIRFTRTWANAGAVTVNYSLAGTAVNGTDYNTLTGVAVIPANAASVDVLLTPIDDNDDEDNESADVTLLTGIQYRVGSPSTGSIVVSDNDTSGFIISAISANTQEADAATTTARTFTVRLATRPSGTVVLNFASSNVAEGLIDTNSAAGNQNATSLSFTAADWNTNKTVQVFGQNDDFDDGDIGYFISIVINQALTLDSRYDPLDPPDVGITNIDNDTAGVVISLISGPITEAGGTATFQITLASQPYNPVNFTLSSADTTEGVLQAGSSAVTINPASWATGATITVQGVDDDIDDDNQSFKIDVNKSTSSDPAYNNLGGWDVSVTCNDNDTKGVTLGALAANPIVEGASTTYTLSLNSRPIGVSSVVLNFSGGAELTVDADSVTPGTQTSLTIPAAEWATVRTITITAIDDPDIEGAHSGTVTTTVQVGSGDYSSGVAIANVNCSITDNDTPGFTVAPTTSVGNRQITTEAGGTATFAVRLKTRPAVGQVVAVRLNSNDLTEGRVGATPISLSSNTTTGATNRINFLDAVDLSQLAVGMRLTVLGAGANSGTQTTVSAFSNSSPKYIDVAADVVDAGVETIRVFPAAPATVALASIGANNATNTVLFADATDLSAVVLGTSITVESVATANTGLLAVVTAIDNTAPGKSITINPYTGSPALVTTGSAETVRFALPMTLTFGNADWNIDQAVTVTGIDDAVNDTDQNYGITFDIAPTTTDPNYALVTQTNQLMKNLDDDIPGIAIVQTLGTTAVTEADVTVTGQDTFTVRLNTDPGTFAVVTLATNGQVTLDKTTLVFTPTGANAYNLPQTVTVTAVNDAVDEAAIHDGTITFSISGYGAITTADPVVCQVTDNDTAGISVVPTLGLVTTENLLATNFAVSLASQPTGNVTIALSSSNTAEGTVSPASVVFTSTNWYLSQSVTVTGVNDDVDDGDQSYNVVTAAATSTDPSYNGVNPPDVVVVNVDNDTAGVTITQSGGSTTATEGGATDSFTVVLNSRPASGSVVVTASPGSQVSLSATTLTFTTANWSTAQSVTVTAVNDNVAEGSHSTNIGFSASGPAYTGLSIPSLTVSITDNDTAGTTVSGAAVTTTEAGGTGTFTFRLNTQPTANVTVVLASNDTTEGTVSPSSLTFTPGDFSTTQTVTLTGVDDDIDDGDIGYGTTFTLVSADPAYNNLAVTTKAVTNTDNDSAGFAITTISNALREDGTSGRFTVRLTSEPTAAVTIGVAVSDATEAAVSAATLTFDANNWNEPQEVTVSGVDDSLNDGDVATSVVLSADTTTSDTNYLNRNPADVVITTQDDDQAGVVTSVPVIATSETGSAVTFTVQLLSQPSADVTIPLSSSDTTEGTVAPGAGLTFTSANWNTPQTVTVTPVDDFAVDGTVAYTVLLGTVTTTDTTGYAGLNPNDVTVNNADNDAAAFTLSATTATTSEGATTAVIQVVLTSQPSANVTLTVTGLNATEGSLSATTLTFTPAVGTPWNVPQNLTITGVNDAYDDGDRFYTLTLTPGSTDGTYSALPAKTIGVTNTDNDAAGVVITQSAGTTVVNETGATDTYTVQLTSRPVGTATITVTPDSQVRVNGSVSPIVLTFDPAQSNPAANGWDTVRTITVSAVVDLIDETNPHTANIIHTVANYVDQASAAVTASPVSVTVIDNDPPVASVTSLTLGRGSSATITSAMISATDVETPAANLLFTVILAPGQGELWLDYGLGTADQLINGDTFTQAAITANRLTYRNSGTPNVSDGFAFRVSDAVGNQGNLTIFNITVTGFIPPSITLNGSYSPTYIENAVPVAVDNAPSVTDPDSVTYSLLTITLSGTGVSTDDELFFATTGPITASSNTILYSGTPIATYTGGTGTTALTVSFNVGVAGDAQLTDLFSALRYRNTSEDPVAGTRTVSIVLRDDTSTENVAETKDIAVLAINDPPVVADATLITPKNVAVTSTLTTFDVDNYPLTIAATAPGKGTLSGVLVGGGSNVVNEGDSLAFTYTPVTGQDGIDSFDVTVTDPDGASATATITVLIVGGTALRPWIVSDPPVEVEQGAPMTGTPLSYDIVVDYSELLLAEQPTQPSDVTFTLVGTLPAGVTFDGFTSNGTNAALTLTIGSSATGVIEAGIVVTVTAANTSTYQPLTIVIVPSGTLGN